MTESALDRVDAAGKWPDYAYINQRCCRCQTVRLFDADNKGTETLDGAYVCPTCKRAIEGAEAQDWASRALLAEQDRDHYKQRCKDLQEQLVMAMQAMAGPTLA